MKIQILFLASIISSSLVSSDIQKKDDYCWTLGDQLPHEIVAKIIDYCDSKTIFCLRLTNKQNSSIPILIDYTCDFDLQIYVNLKECTETTFNYHFGSRTNNKIQFIKDNKLRFGKNTFCYLYNINAKLGIQLFCNALEENTLITHLSLPSLRLTIGCATILANMLQKNKNLTNLNLPNINTHYTSSGEVSILIDALTTNSTVQHLSFNTSTFGSDLIQQIAVMIQDNNTLKSLHMAATGINGTDMHFLHNALKKNTCLTELDLSYNFINNQVFCYLADVLKINSTLQVLNIISKYTMSYAAPLKEALAQNTTLKELTLGPVTKDVHAVLNSIQESNKTVNIIIQ